MRLRSGRNQHAALVPTGVRLVCHVDCELVAYSNKFALLNQSGNNLAIARRFTETLALVRPVAVVLIAGFEGSGVEMIIASATNSETTTSTRILSARQATEHAGVRALGLVTMTVVLLVGTDEINNTWATTAFQATNVCAEMGARIANAFRLMPYSRFQRGGQDTLTDLQSAPAATTA